METSVIAEYESMLFFAWRFVDVPGSRQMETLSAVLIARNLSFVLQLMDSRVWPGQSMVPTSLRRAEPLLFGRG